MNAEFAKDLLNLFARALNGEAELLSLEVATLVTKHKIGISCRESKEIANHIRHLVQDFNDELMK